MELGQRDVAIVEFVGRFGQASSSHIAFACFTTRSFTPTARALRRLCKNDFLYRVGVRASDPIKGGSGASAYMPGRLGWVLTHQQGKWKPHKVNSHTLAVTDRYIDLLGAERLGTCKFIRPPEVEKPIGNARCDLYVELGDPVRKVRLDVAIEVELTGREHRIREKCRAYLEAAGGWPDHFPLVVFAVPDEAHKAEVVRVLKELRPEERQYFACLLFSGFAGELLKLA